MRFDEFGYVDVVTESKRLLRQLVRNRLPNLTEDINQNKEYAATFVEMALGENIIDSQLVVNNYYYPMSIAFDYAAKAGVIIKVIQEAKFVRFEGSRLVFEYDNGTRDLKFPAEQYASEDNFRFVYDNKSSFDQIISIFALKFNGQHWDWQIYEYGIDGMPVQCDSGNNY